MTIRRLAPKNIQASNKNSSSVVLCFGGWNGMCSDSDEVLEAQVSEKPMLSMHKSRGPWSWCLVFSELVQDKAKRRESRLFSLLIKGRGSQSHYILWQRLFKIARGCYPEHPDTTLKFLQYGSKNTTTTKKAFPVGKISFMFAMFDAILAPKKHD